MKATAGAPLVFRTIPGKEHKATFTTGVIGSGTGIYIEFSDHVHIYDLRVATSQKGVEYLSGSFGQIEGLMIEKLGQEAIGIGRKHTEDGSNQFLGVAAQSCDVIGNTIRDTGNVTAEYGEGIYIGTGAFDGDDTHDVFIGYNQLNSIRAEGIELKPFAYNLVVRGNLITNSSHAYNAAITVAVEPRDFQDGNYLIEDNRIYNYQSTHYSVAGIAIGHGNAVIRNNVIWVIDTGYGIRTYTTFVSLGSRDVTINNNTVWIPGTAHSIALHTGDAGSGVRDKPANVTLSNNATDDGSAGSTLVSESDFVGPITGIADAGKGPGSGFQFKSYSGLGANLSLIVGP